LSGALYKKDDLETFHIGIIYYRHLSSKDGASVEEIKLYIIDTTLFPRGMFIREIVSNFQPGWGFPLAIYFAALISPESARQDQETANDKVFFVFFRSERFYGKGASIRCQKL
jgi:hypothetical protein